MAAPGQPSALSRISTPFKFVIGAALLILIGFGYWLVFYTDIANKIAQERARGAQLNNDLVAANNAYSSYLADRDELNNLEDKAREFNKSLPVDRDQAAFLQSVQEAMNTAGVSMEKYIPGDDQPQAFYVKEPMRIEMKGKFFQVTKFMHEVGKLDRIINMENIELVTDHIQGDEINLSGRCLATAFHALKAKPAAAPGAPGAPGGQPQ
jgi:type IV pilus assembly protein PilO